MTASVPPRGAARSAVRTGSVSPDVAAHAFSDLAALAACVSGTPSVQINVVQGDVSRQVATFGNETGEVYAHQTVIPVNDHLGRILGTLCLFNSAVTEVSQDQSRILAGLARQAAALIQLGGDSPRHVPDIEEQFEDILELIPDAIIMHAKGKVTFVNSALLKLSGTRNTSDVVGKPVASLFAPETREAVENRVEEITQRGLPTARRTLRYRRHDGKEIPLEVASMAVMLAGEECRLVVARDVSPRMEAAENLRELPYGDSHASYGHYSAKIIPLPNDTVAIENVTEERRNREVLRQSVERFELIARATNDGVRELKLPGREVWWNKRAYQMLGYDPGTVAPSEEAWKERIHPEDRLRSSESFLEAVNGQSDTWTMEYRILRPDGSISHIYSRGYVVRDDSGAPVRMLGTMLDITELKRAENAVRESEEKYRKLVEVLPDVIAIMVDGKIAFINRAGIQFIGAEDEKEILGRQALEFFHPDSREVVIRRLQQLDMGEVIQPMEHKFLRKDGTCIEAESRAISFPYQGNLAKLAVIRDITARKKAELALRTSEERYRLLFLNNPQPMWLYDTTDLRFLDVNEAAVTKYGYTREEFLDRTMKDIWLEEDHVHLDLAGVMDTQRPAMETSELRRHRRKDGSVIHAEVYHRYLEFSGKGAAIALANDFTEKLETLERLRHSEERYRTLAAVSPVGLYRTDVQGRYTYVNDHVCGLLGRSQDQMLGLVGIVFIHPDDLGWVTETWKAADAGGVPFQAEYRMLNSNGRIFWVMGNALADKDSDGKPIGYIGTISDITERKEAEILLACQKRTLAMVASGWHLHDVLDSLVNYVEKESSGAYGCVLQLDAESKRLVWLAARGVPDSFRSQAPSFPLHREGGALGLSAIAKEYAFCPDIAADEGWTNGGNEAIANGLKACASRPILGSFGQVLGVFAFFYPKVGEPAAYDIKLLETASDLAAIAMERRRQEEISRKNQELSEQNLRIQEASRMKSEFLANMSHELRTPLNAIIGFSQLLIDRKVGHMNEKQTEYLGDILDGGMHLLRLINDVLDLAKIEAGKMQLFREDTHVLLAMREVCDILMPMALGKDVTLHCSADPDGESGILDGGKIRQVLYNLVSNAIKFSKQGGKVTVVSGPDGNGGILLRVFDQGIGIRKDDIPKLFRQFQQLDSGSARHYPGSGLGLVITKKLVELHGGTVEVESVFGEGSIFSAVFPRFAGDE